MKTRIAKPRRRVLAQAGALAAAWAGAPGATLLLAACGGSDGAASEPVELVPPFPPPAPTPPVVPVDGPPWPGFARDAQHSAIGAIAAQQLVYIYWQSPLDLAPQLSYGALLTHYGSPVITRHNTVIVPVKTGATDGFRVDARIGANGVLVWSQASDYRLPPHRWIPSFNPVLTPEATPRLVMPASGGRLLVREDPDAASGAVSTVVFYGVGIYAAAPASYDASVFINTPLTSDGRGNLFFGFTVTAANPAGLVGGIARVAPDGTGIWVGAAAASGDPSLVKPQTNCAPALSRDESTLYVVVNSVPPAGVRASGRLLALDATTLATRSQVALRDPATGANAYVSDDATASPTIGPDGDVYIGVLESNAPGHNYRGWLLHFDATLALARTPGSFGWDDTASIVPATMVPAYTGPSSYLLLTKYNNYGGAGTGNGLNRVAVIDPAQTQDDPITPGVPVMKDVLVQLGPTPDPAWPGGVMEWCINTAAVDPLTNSVLINSEDGVLYRWHLPSNRFSEAIRLNSGRAQSYTPTAIGADGRVYAVNNATLHSIGQ